MTEHVTTSSVSTRGLAGRTVAVLTLDNGVERRPNTFGTGGLESFATAMDTVESLVEAGEVRGVVVTGKPGSFLAGADLAAFAALTDEDQAYEFSAEGKRQFARLQSLVVPSVALLTGMALGGGLELALYCGARVALPEARFVGLPETFLGLVPGWSGCVHLPQLVGPEIALQLLVDRPLAGNRLTKVAEAVELGVLDAVAGEDAWEVVGEFIVAPPQRTDHTGDTQAWEQALMPRRAIAESRAEAGSTALTLLLELVAGARTASAADLAHRESAISRDVTMSDANRRNLYAFGLLSGRGEQSPGDERIATVLGREARTLPAEPSALSLEDLEPHVESLRRAVQGLLDDGHDPSRIDTVALKHCGWPIHFGGLLPILDALSEDEAFLPRGRATVPDA